MMRAVYLLVVVAADTSTCGYACEDDFDCGGCGGKAGKCSSPAKQTAHPDIAATCVNRPEGAPAEPQALVGDSVWPSQWVADVEAWTYPDFGNGTKSAKGRFFYDGVRGRTRTEWHPYTNGKDAVQIWVAATGNASSYYYVKTGPLCLGFPIKDPGAGGSVGVEKADWMKSCNDAGLATYLGRELVAGEWADHWACIVNDDQRNMSIVFQNWHSVGLGTSPKGLPLRVTGGNSAPDSKKGAPRLSTVWYRNFDIGPVWKESDFDKPSKLCIPVAETTLKEFVGEEITPLRVHSADFHERLRAFPHAEPAKSDVTRARQKIPRSRFRGSTLKGAMSSLNEMLLEYPGLETSACESFNLTALLGIQRTLFHARNPALQRIYAEAKDNRELRYTSLTELDAAQREQHAAAGSNQHLVSMMRDGLCHELVMMYVHHLSESARSESFAKDFTLPLLPERNLHPAPHASADNTDHAEHSTYKNRATCAVCHVDGGAQSLLV
jgi:hypothetical protein